MYFDETELTLRMSRKIPNAKVMVLPQANIVHIGQVSALESIESIKFKLLYLKSKALYFKFQNGYSAFVMVYIRGLITIFLKK